MSRGKGFLRMHRVLWYAVTLLTGILAGFLASHSVMLGRYFTWLIQTGNSQMFVDTFAVFREATHANVHYNLFFWASLVMGIVWTIVSFMVRKDRIVALIAGLSSFWVGCFFFASGFGAAEAAVCTGTADEAVRQFFVSMNLPVHRAFAVFYAACFLLLLVSGCRSRKGDRLPLSHV